MIKYNDEQVTAKIAAKKLIARFGIGTMVDFFNPSDTSVFGWTAQDMPTEEEQHLIYKEYYKQADRVRKFLNIGHYY